MSMIKKSLSYILSVVFLSTIMQIPRGTALKAFASTGDAATQNETIYITEPKIDAGNRNCFVLKEDGTVWGWGLNSSKALGDLTTVNRSLPVQASGVNNIKQISSGNLFTLALKEDGTVWSWGYNYYGQLGNGSKGYPCDPAQVKNLSDIISISAGDGHGAALKSDGTVWTWGWNTNGQLGDGTTTDSYLPVQVQGLSGIVAISAGSLFTTALRNDGTVYAWGANDGGSLGDGTETNKSRPVQVKGIDKVTSISSGGGFTIAVEEDGTAWSWGWNRSGTLGIGNEVDQLLPVKIQGINNIIEISAGLDHALALKSDGTVLAWGGNYFGTIGDGTGIERTSPVQVTSLRDVRSVSAGYSVSMALKDDGTVWVWGMSSEGTLGNGTFTPGAFSYTPIPTKASIKVVFQNPVNDLSIVSTFPANGAANVDRSSKDITIKFNKDVDISTGTGNIKIIDYDTDKVVLTYNMITGSPVGDVVYKNADDKTEIKLENALDALHNFSKYYVIIDDKCIRADEVVPPNFEYVWFGGISDKSIWNFSTLTFPDGEDISGPQYLAMSKLTTSNIDGCENQRVVDIAQRFGNSRIWSPEYWSAVYGPCETLYSDLYTKCLKDWKIAEIKRNDDTGFFAVAFENMYTNQSVISYRASDPFSIYEKDWWENDFPIYFNNAVTLQFNDAIDFYEDYSSGIGYGRKISITGHSLGGGLGLMVSTLYDLDAQLFDSAPTLDVSYYNLWDKMSRNFTGIDKWKYTDNDSENDSIIGMREYSYKRAVKHRNWNFNTINPWITHDLDDLIFPIGGTGQGDNVSYELTDAVSCNIFNENSKWSKNVAWKGFLVLGTSKGEKLKGSMMQDNVIYGGDGDDSLYGFDRNDVLIGGHGNDTLDGSTGNDSYVYWKNDGVDEIKDFGGKDTLYIYGYDNIDEITIDSDSDNNYVLIKGDNKVITKISKMRLTNSQFTVKTNTKEGVHKIDLQGFNNWKNVKNIVVKCPVEMRIYDANNNLVLTLDNSQERSVYTDYGYFYVVKQEGTNDYTKIANIIDNNYTIKLIGTDNGKMDFSESWFDDENNLKTAFFNDVPITQTTIITTNTHYFSDIVLNIDYNNDGINDNILQPSDIVTGDIASDDIKPTISSSLTGTAGENGWYTSDVNYKLMAEDNIGVKQITYTCENVTNKYLNEFTISKEGTTKISSVAEDYNNNSSETITDTINIDKTPPVITANIEDGSEFELNQTVPFTFNANDSVSGLGSVVSTVESGNIIDTATPGNKTINVTAIDKAGNRVTKIINYKVVYKFGGILQPINNDGSSIFKLGSTVPVKFQLKDSNGAIVNNASVKLYTEKTSDQIMGAFNESDSSNTSDSESIFRYDADAKQYIYNLSTKNMSAGTWSLKLTLDDSTEKYVIISLR